MSAARLRSRRRGGLLGACLLSALLGATPARGDGGAVLRTARCGPYRVTVFALPAPLRAGPADLSLLVQDAATGRPLPAVRASLRLSPPGGGARRLVEATHAAATNTLLLAARLRLSVPGAWTLELRLTGPRGPAALRVPLEVAPPAPAWWALWPWLGLPLPVALAYALVEAERLRRAARPRPARGRPPG